MIIVYIVQSNAMQLHRPNLSNCCVGWLVGKSIFASVASAADDQYLCTVCLLSYTRFVARGTRYQRSKVEENHVCWQDETLVLEAQRSEQCKVSRRSSNRSPFMYAEIEYWCSHGYTRRSCPGMLPRRQHDKMCIARRIFECKTQKSVQMKELDQGYRLVTLAQRSVSSFAHNCQYAPKVCQNFKNELLNEYDSHDESG